MRPTEKLWSLRYPILVLVFMQAFDTLSTVLALGVGAQEANPLMAQVLHSAGAAWLVVIKWAVVALVFLAVVIDPLEKPYLRAALVIMNVVYGIVLSSNFFVYGTATGEWALPVAFWALVVALGAAALPQPVAAD